MRFPKDNLPEMFIPLTDKTRYAVTPDETLIIASPEGFYRPVLEKDQNTAEDCGCYGKAKPSTKPQEPAKDTIPTVPTPVSPVQPVQVDSTKTDSTQLTALASQGDSTDFYKALYLQTKNESDSMVKAKEEFLKKMRQQEIDLGLK